MTSNQRFAAELIVLLTIGVLIWAKAEPKRQDQYDKETQAKIQDVVHTRRLIVYGNRGSSEWKLVPTRMI